MLHAPSLNEHYSGMDNAPILICYDGSDESKGAIDAAAALLGPRRAIVLDLGPPLTEAESYAALSPVLPGEAFEELNTEDATASAVEGAKLAQTAGFRAEAHGAIGAPTWQGIVDAADEIDAAAIVMGTRALTGAREAFEGSVSHQVVEHAGRPVLIVPPPHKKG